MGALSSRFDGRLVLNTMDAAVKNFALALAPVRDSLNLLDEHLPLFVESSVPEVQKLLAEVLEGIGKKIRPAFFFLSCRLCDYNGEHKMAMAAVMEFVHTASLLHDDVLDNSPLRRNRPTLHTRHGAVSAILVGDLIYARASEMMTETGSLEIVHILARAIRLMSEAELLQLQHVFDMQMPFERYIAVLEGKTASLLGASCRSAAILAGKDTQQRVALEQFGFNIGLAFQLLDDALDYTAEAAQFGKKPFSDLKEGRMTLPLLKIIEHATAAEKALLKTSLQDPKNFEDCVALLTTLSHQYGAVQFTLELADSYTAKAIAILKTNFPDSPARQQLEALSLSLLVRPY